MVAQEREPLSAQIGVRMTPAEVEAVELVAAFEGVSKGEVLRRLLPEVVDRAAEIGQIVERIENHRKVETAA